MANCDKDLYQKMGVKNWEELKNYSDGVEPTIGTAPSNLILHNGNLTASSIECTIRRSPARDKFRSV